MVHIAESTVGRRYAGWFIKNTERAQKIYVDLVSFARPLLANVSSSMMNSERVQAGATVAAVSGGVERDADSSETQRVSVGARKVAWADAKV